MFNRMLTKQNVFVCTEMYRTNVRPNPVEYYKSLLISVKQKLLSVFEDIIKTWQDYRVGCVPQDAEYVQLLKYLGNCSESSRICFLLTITP